ncbi:MAG: hypothetical protein AAAC48_03120 [Phyllobacterium sp.]
MRKIELKVEDEPAEIRALQAVETSGKSLSAQFNSQRDCEAASLR